MPNRSEPLAPPQARFGRSLARGVIEGTVELLPGAGLLTNIYHVTHPPVEEMDRKRWEDEITRRSNEQDVQIKRVVCAFLQLKANCQQANSAQRLSFVRGGIVSTLEAIMREGLTQQLSVELRQKMETTASDVEDLLKGLDAALLAMTEKEQTGEFADILRETVFGVYGKSSIRLDINRLLQSDRLNFELQKELASEVCQNIDYFNTGLQRLSNCAATSISLE